MNLKGAKSGSTALKTQVLIFCVLIVGIVAGQLIFNLQNSQAVGDLLAVHKKSRIIDSEVDHIQEALANSAENKIRLSNTHIKDTIKNLEDLNRAVGVSIDKIKLHSYNAEWAAGLKKMQELHRTMIEATDKIGEQIGKRKSLDRELSSAISDSAEVSITGLKKFLPSYRRHISDLYNDFMAIEKAVKKMAGQHPKDPKDFIKHLDGHLQRARAGINYLLAASKSSSKLHDRVEKTNRIVTDYFNKVQEFKGVVESLNYLSEKEVLSTKRILGQFVKSIKEGVKSDQKLAYEDHEEKIREIKFINITASSVMIGLFLIFIAQFLRVIYQPLVDLAKTMHELALEKPSSFPLVPNRHHEIGQLIKAMKKFTDAVIRRIKEDIYKIDDSIEYQLDMVATTAEELAKASVHISKLSDIYDSKIKEVHDANDMARRDFREIVKASTIMDGTLSGILKKMDSGQRKNIRRNELEKLEKELKVIIDAAHKAAIEAQNLSRRITSMSKNNEESEKVAKMFSKAGNKVSVLAHSLKGDTKNFFNQAEGYLDHVDDDDFE